MTIDAIIARLTFDAITQDKDFQVKTTKAIDFLARHKDECRNDFDKFLTFKTKNFDEQQRSYEASLADLKNEGYSLFLDVISLKQIANSVSENLDANQVFISYFLENNKGNAEIFTDNAQKFVDCQKQILSFSQRVVEDFTKINLDFDAAICSVESKDDDKGMVVLANANRFLSVSGGSPKYLKDDFNKKIKELGISTERLLAYDLTFLRDYGSEKADEMRKAGLLGYGATQYVDTVSRYVSMERNYLLRKAEEKETGVKSQKDFLCDIFPNDEKGMMILAHQWDYELDKSLYGSKEEKVM